jgi:Flp pilus assembly protein TadG
MLTKINQFLKKRESGDSEIVSMLILTPIALFLLFAMISISSYYQARSTVQEAASAGARQVALYGGTAAGLSTNVSHASVVTFVKNRLVNSAGNCSRSYCYQAPDISCTPGVVHSLADVTSCTVTYYFSPFTNDIFGFSAATRLPFTITAYYTPETYFPSSVHG